jgi:hypothetical protein
MKPINLLPRKTWLEKWHKLLIPMIAIVFLLSWATLFQYTLQVKAKAAQMRDETAELQKEIGLIAEMLQPDPIVQLYNRFAADIERTAGARFDWMAALHAAANHLPDNSRLVSVKAEGSGMMEATIHFADLEQAAAYLDQLKGTSMFSDVEARSFLQREVLIEGKTAESMTRLTYYEAVISLKINRTSMKVKQGGTG